jgi:hypothetical protein
MHPTKLNIEYMGFWQKINTRLKTTAKLLNIKKRLKYIQTL